MEDDERSEIAQKSKENEVVPDENPETTVKTMGRRTIVPRDLSKYPDFPVVVMTRPSRPTGGNTKGPRSVKTRPRRDQDLYPKVDP